MSHEEENEENHEENKGLKVKVQVSGKEEIERLKEELADRDAKLEMIAEKAFENAKKEVAQALHMSEDEANQKITSPEDLNFYRGVIASKQEQALASKRNPATPTGGGASGKAPLYRETSHWANNQALPLDRDDKGKVIVPQNWKMREYNDIGEMIEVLRELQDNPKYKHADKEEAKEIHGQLLKKLGEQERENFKPEAQTYTGSLRDLIEGKATMSDWKPTKKTKEMREGD